MRHLAACGLRWSCSVRPARCRLDGAGGISIADQRARLRQWPGNKKIQTVRYTVTPRRTGRVRADRCTPGRKPTGRKSAGRKSADRQPRDPQISCANIPACRPSSERSAAAARPPSWPSAKGRGRQAHPARQRVVFRLAAPGAALLAAVVPCSPSPRRAGRPRRTPSVALLDMPGLALLLVGVARLVTTGHRLLLLQMEFKSENAPGGVQFRARGCRYTGRARPDRRGLRPVCGRADGGVIRIP